MPALPIFLTYPASGEIGEIVTRAAAARPLFDFTAPDGIGHSVWLVGQSDRDALITAFGRIPLLYIADGHHRAASAMRARQALAGTAMSPSGPVTVPAGQPEADSFLAVAFPHDQMQVLPYSARVVVQPGTETPAGKGEVSMYLDGRWHRLRLAPAPSDAPEADRLDVSLLHAQVLEPLLGIGDPRTDKRIDFVGGIRGPKALAALVDSGAAAVAFAMHPVSVEDLMRIADAGGIMPPKSTWFEPKLRDGLLSHLI